MTENLKSYRMTYACPKYGERSQIIYAYSDDEARDYAHDMIDEIAYDTGENTELVRLEEAHEGPEVI